MHEQEWLAGTDLARMLRSVEGQPRRLRLFACACCRSIWPLMKDYRSRHAIEVAEQFADGHISDEELSRAVESAFAATDAAIPDRETTASRHGAVAACDA